MKFVAMILFLATATWMGGCSPRITAPPVSAPGPESFSAPQEPFLNLAWRSAQQIRAGLQDLGLPGRFKIVPVDGAGLPPEAVRYFQAVLETRLQTYGIRMPGDAPMQLEGALYILRDQLVFGMKLRSGDEVVFSDSASIPRDERLENTLAQFPQQAPQHHAQGHGDVAIPTPVAQLDEAPLDVNQFCAGRKDPCDLAILYADRVEIVNWRTLTRRIQTFPAGFLASTRSRAPSGKIVRNGEMYVVLSNNLSGPLVYDSEFQGPVAGVTLPPLPAAAAGLNSYVLGDGRFYDFEPLGNEGLAVVEASGRLGVAVEGALSTATEPAGGTLASRWPVLYTSAPVLPGETDSVRKFEYRDGILTLETSRPATGEILDLSVTDLNHDDRAELLVTARRSEGIFIEVWEAF